MQSRPAVPSAVQVARPGRRTSRTLAGENRNISLLRPWRIFRLKDRLQSFVRIPSENDDEFVGQAPAVPIGSIVRRFWPYVRSRKRGVFVLILFTSMSPVIAAGEIAIFKMIVDEVLVPRHFAEFPRIATYAAILTVISGVLRFSDGLLSTSLSQRFIIDLRGDVFRHVQSLSVDFVERRRRGDLVSRITGDISTIESFILGGTTSFVSSVVSLAVFTAMLLILDWHLALVTLAVAPMFWLIARHFTGLVKQASREKRRRSGSISVVVEEALRNAALVHAYNGQAREDERLLRAGEAKYRAEMASARLRGIYSPMIDAVETVGAFVVIGYGAWRLAHNDLTVGGLLAFLALLGRLFGPIRGLSSLATSGFSAAASAERVIELLDATPRVVDPPEPVRLGPGPLGVTFDDVTFRYPGSEAPSLTHVGFTVAPGQVLALVGASGAGKSSTAKLLLRMYDADEGCVRVGGIDVRSLRVAQLRDSVAVVLQETLVFDGSVRDNIAYGLPGATDDQVKAAARAADAHEFITRLPDGYATRIGEHGSRLSGGQRQRLAVARALIKDAPIVLLDEPTTGLDARSAARILGPTRRLMAGRTTVLISHDLMLTREADEIVVLDQGRVVEHGTHDELMAVDGTYARLYRSARHVGEGRTKDAERGRERPHSEQRTLWLARQPRSLPAKPQRRERGIAS